MDIYFSGEKLYGDDFSINEIEQWYKDEEEAYANLYGNCGSNTDLNDLEYANLDVLFGYKYLPDKKFTNVLGFGSSWGYEFLPIINEINNLTIIDSSEQTISKKLGNIVPNYVKATISGKIDFPDNSFDLISCFSVLHHIPNVTFVISELVRVLQPCGYLLLREPINSMGDWNGYRQGLTKRERGIPPKYLQKIIASQNCRIKKVTYHHFIYSFLNRIMPSASFLRSKLYLKLDHILSELFLWNFHYHPKNKLQRISPHNIYYVLQKTQ
jgi:SAM-dependent methyltransferase